MTRRSMVVLLGLGLLGAAALFGLTDVAGSRRTPGTWTDPYFRIPPQDREAYRLARRGRQLFVILPHAGDLDPKMDAGAQVPVIATAEVGAGDLSGIALTGKEACGGALRGIATPGAGRAKANPGRLRALFARDATYYVFWMSPRRDWAAACDPKEGRCEAVFLNAGWVADFPLDESGLCRAPAMNARFAALVEKWRRGNRTLRH